MAEIRAESPRTSLPRARGRGAGAEQLRRHNLSTILTLLHHDGSQPRSALTARTGLNRSTVASLVAELVDRGLVFESEPDPTNLVGRPSPTVNTDRGTVGIAVNPEVDAVTVGVVALGGNVLHRVRHDLDHVPTPAEAADITAAALTEITHRFDPSRIVGVGVAVPGLVRAGDGLVRLAPHLDWRDVPLSDLISEATGHPAWVGNDANLGATAEHIHGAGRGIAEMIYLNGGPSGIGGGIIANGALIGGAGGYAGEFGHGVVGSSPGPRGVLEDVVGRAALLDALGLRTATADELEQALLASSAPEVASVVHAQLDRLAVALGNSINTLNPQRIVLGGFLGSLLLKDGDYLRDRVRAVSLSAPHESVEIVPASLGSDLLMIGAAELAFANLLDDPGALQPVIA